MNSGFRAQYVALASLWSIMFLLSLAGIEAPWAKSDGKTYHAAYIEKCGRVGFNEALERPDAAMPPLYHCTAAVLSRLTGLPTYAAGKAISMLSLLSIIALAGLAVNQGLVHPILLPLSLILSWPLLSASLSPVTDTLGILFLLTTLWAIANGYVLLSSAAVVLAILVRQYYVTLALACLCAAAHALFSNRRDVKEFSVFLAPGIAGMGAMYYLYIAWGGFVPVEFRNFYAKAYIVNWSALTVSLAYISIFAAVYLVQRKELPTVRMCVFAGAIAVALGFILPIGYSFDDGRWGSMFWSMSQRLPRSAQPLVFALCFFPAVLLLIKYLSMRVLRRDLISTERIFFASLLLILVFAFASQPYAWQRYIDPMLGIAFAFLVASKRTAQKLN